MVTLSDMPANNPLTTRVRNQSITISQEQCQKMMGLSKNKQTSTKEGEREVLKVQKMFPSILCVKNHFGEEFLQQSQQCQQLYELCSELIYTVTECCYQLNISCQFVRKLSSKAKWNAAIQGRGANLCNPNLSEENQKSWCIFFQMMLYIKYYKLKLVAQTLLYFAAH